ncbi:MAG: DUF418 domain-containing protein [Bacillus sp. (in: Bacteria)]|nr:DUF418 domain-containing protein [Bacillus sp. (in: firmicutes)]
MDNNSSNKSVEKLTPLDGKERLTHIDSLRGFALLGILIVNMLAFQYGTVGYKFFLPELPVQDQPINTAIELFFQGSFYPVFAILFGFGAVIMFERSATKNGPFNTLFFRRLLLLLLIGLIHMYFIWDGDVLVTYAISGLLFMVFIKRKKTTLLTWFILLTFLIHSMGILPEDETNIALNIDFQPFAELEQEVFTSGTYMDVVTHRFTNSPFDKMDFGPEMDPIEQEILVSVLSASAFIVMVIQVLILFILGGLLAKSKWLHDPAQNRNTLITLAGFMLIIGLAIKGWMVMGDNPTADYLGYFIGGPMVGVGYIAAFVLIYSRFSSTSIFTGLGAVGRIALTNYLLQSIIMTTLFYGYGIGLFGKLGTLVGTLLALAVFILQIIGSKWWLKRYRFGPMEYLWRTGTYLKFPSFKK